MWILALLLANLSFILLNAYAIGYLQSLIFDKEKWWMYLIPIITIIISTSAYILSAYFIYEYHLISLPTR